MSKILKGINYNISLNKEELNSIISLYKKLKINIKPWKIKLYGSFEKQLITNKTKDIDIDVIMENDDVLHHNKNANKFIEKVIEFLKKHLSLNEDNYNYSYKERNVDFEFPINNNIFTFSFTFKYKNFNSDKYNLKFKKQENKKINPVLELEDEQLKFNDFLDQIQGKKKRWRIRKFIKIMKYDLTPKKNNISLYLLENKLANELKEVNNAFEMFEKYKFFLKNLGEGNYDSAFNYSVDNESFLIFKNGVKKIFNRIENYELKDYLNEWIKN